MVSVLHKELDYKLEWLKYKRLEVVQPEDQKQIRTSSWWINPSEGGLLTFFAWKGEAYEREETYLRGGCLGGDVIEDLQYSKAQ